MIDFHVHLDLYPSPEEIVRQCRERGIFVLSVTNTPSAWEGTARLAERAPRIRTALGLHPQLAHQRKHELILFDQLIPNVKYVGEIGLDGAPENRHSWLDQLLVFDHILSSCKIAGGKIMTIHSRRAATAVLDGLDRYPGAGTAVLHWFSGTRRELRRAIDAGCWFSVGPGMLTSSSGRRLLEQMPRERVLTESDGPFTEIDSRRALPWDVQRACDVITELWKCKLPETQEQLAENLRSLVS